jgi:hypothetical protein
MMAWNNSVRPAPQKAGDAEHLPGFELEGYGCEFRREQRGRLTIQDCLFAGCDVVQSGGLGGLRAPSIRRTISRVSAPLTSTSVDDAPIPHDRRRVGNLADLVHPMADVDDRDTLGGDASDRMP